LKEIIRFIYLEKLFVLFIFSFLS